MSRVAPVVSIEFLKAKIDAYEDDYLLRETIEDDLKVDFDFENWQYQYEPFFGPLVGYCTLANGFTFLGCSAGGDWEYSVWFCIYWDGKRLRAYVPTEGNPFNSKTKRAYGNDDESDRNDMLRRWPELKELEEEQDRAVEVGDVERDYGLILKDLIDRIKVKN